MATKDDNLSDWSIVSRNSRAPQDWRDLTTGNPIPTESYSDQPFLVATDDDAWLCCVTTGSGVEGQPGQHVVSMRSTDRGKTWSAPLDVEPAKGPESSYAVLHKTAYGRIYVFYNYNHENIRQIKADNPPYTTGFCTRVDSLGQYVCKYSDDHGKTWSSQRFPIPVREFEIDRKNPYQGKIRYFWNVGKPFVLKAAVFVSLHKVGGIGHGFFTSSEGVLLRSPNMQTERDPAKLAWETLPDGDKGLRTPAGGGPIAEEQSYSVMDDGSIYCVYRTTDGHPVETYSRDGGHTWDAPKYKAYADGRPMKHPRAANFAWKCSNGKYLYWFHNHGGRDYEDRNPVWVSAGVEVDSKAGRVIKWTQPEILLYEDDPYIRVSYPDLIEAEGHLFISETQKCVGRTHRIPKSFLDTLWSQFEIKSRASEGLLLEAPGSGWYPLETLPPFTLRDHEDPNYRRMDTRGGISFDFWLDQGKLAPDAVLFGNETPGGKGFCVFSDHQGALCLRLSDGQTVNIAVCDRETLESPGAHHVAIVIDNGPKVVYFVVDDRFQDGGAARQFGWTRYSPLLQGIGGGKLNVNYPGVKSLRIYGRPLMTTEAIGNYRHGR